MREIVYNTLNSQKNARMDDIQEQYEQLILNTANCSLLSQAYDIISDDESRRMYDKLLENDVFKESYHNNDIIQSIPTEQTINNYNQQMQMDYIKIMQYGKSKDSYYNDMVMNYFKGADKIESMLNHLYEGVALKKLSKEEYDKNKELLLDVYTDIIKNEKYLSESILCESLSNNSGFFNSLKCASKSNNLDIAYDYSKSLINSYRRIDYNNAKKQGELLINSEQCNYLVSDWYEIKNTILSDLEKIICKYPEAYNYAEAKKMFDNLITVMKMQFYQASEYINKNTTLKMNVEFTNAYLEICQMDVNMLMIEHSCKKSAEREEKRANKTKRLRFFR